MRLMIVLLIAHASGAVAAQDSSRASNGKLAAAKVEQFQRALDEAIANRDSAAVQRMLANDFTLIHSTGRVESKASIVQAAAAGTLSQQKVELHLYDISTQMFRPDLAISTRRALQRDTARHVDTWLESRSIYVQTDDHWQIVSAQSTLIHEGPSVDPNVQKRFVGQFSVAGNNLLKVSQEGEALIAQLPNGTRLQVFVLGDSDLELDRYRQLHFTRDDRGQPIEVSLLRDGAVVWRAKRSAP